MNSFLSQRSLKHFTTLEDKCDKIKMMMVCISPTLEARVGEQSLFQKAPSFDPLRLAHLLFVVDTVMDVCNAASVCDGSLQSS